mgnify:CR=1 FL=1
MERLRRISDENNRIIFYDISIWNNIYDNKQKYKLQGDLKELCFPPVFSKILYGCFIISMICSVVIIYLWQDTGITILFLVMGDY